MYLSRVGHKLHTVPHENVSTVLGFALNSLVYYQTLEFQKLLKSHRHQDYWEYLQEYSTEIKMDIKLELFYRVLGSSRIFTPEFPVNGFVKLYKTD